jgi:diaminohydroxyphosphoribosylaminopyrimidine deaminase / 5-amino-6-(5-phosphoribosylamino)uracil reductase
MHEQFLLAALEQAKLGRGLCAPNPSVGAVAVQNGTIIAQAWHRGAGTLHAEQLLLAQITPKTPGVSVYITLEPCNHWGKTPPCVDALVRHGIEEVIFAFLDPNPIVAQNNSTALLREHGIKVTHLPLAVIDDFYQSYAWWTLTRKPRVTVKMAQTLDGKIGMPQGERLILSNSLCADFTHKMRAESDVILTTARTIARDDPKMNVRLDSNTQAKPVAIIDTHLNLNKEAQIFSTAQHCHIYFGGQSSSNPYPNSSFHSVSALNGKLDLNAIISHLGAAGYHDVWVEAGGTLFSALHQQGLVHRTWLYLVPESLGPQGLDAYQENGLFARKHKVSWHPMDDNMILCIDWLED